jgi:ferredoxin
MLVIHPDECIDCGVCEPECPVDAIEPDTEPSLDRWLDINRQYSETWPNITTKKAAPADADAFVSEPGNSINISAPTLARVIETG